MAMAISSSVGLLVCALLAISAAKYFCSQARCHCLGYTRMGSGAAAVGGVFVGSGVVGVFACWLIFSTGRAGVANSRKRMFIFIFGRDTCCKRGARSATSAN